MAPTCQRDSTEAPVRSSVRVIKQRVDGSVVHVPEDDFLAIEDPLEIVLAYDRHGAVVEKNLTVTMRTPGHEAELIHGFLYAEGIIQSAADITAIDLSGGNPEAGPTRARVRLRAGLDASTKFSERHFAVHSSCGVCGKTRIGHLEIPKSLRIGSHVSVSADWIHGLPGRMHSKQATFRQTGGLHASAIFEAGGGLQVSREDIGRHNALDKAIGASLMAGHTPGRRQVLCVSGRISYEILQKALVARIPVITGVGAARSLAVALANDVNITLIGFVRNGSYNLYSRPERIRAQA